MFFRAKNQRFWLLLLTAVLAVHWDSQLFYYWDEFHVLERFQREGWTTIFRAHNEHLIPLFMGLYFLQVKIFGSFYHGLLAVSLALHVFNSLLLTRLLARLELKPQTAAVAGLMYAASALQAEVMDWAFVQCALLLVTLVLAALHFSLDYLAGGGRFKLCAALTSVVLAPFVFGVGLVASAFVGALCAQQLIAAETAKANFRVKVFQALQLVGGSLLASFAALLIYRAFPAPGVAALDLKTLVHNFQPAFDYLKVGSQFATVLRGSGFFPALELGAAGALLNEVLQLKLPAGAVPELLFAKCGTWLSVFVLLALTIFSPASRRRRAFALWALGQAMIVFSFLLPALGRWQFGLVQALSLRYQTLALLGLMISFAPFLELLLGSRLKAIRLSAYCYLFCFFSLQLVLARNFHYFTDKGRENLKFVAAAREFNAGKRDALPPIPPELTPGRSAEQVAAILRGL